MKVEIPKNFDYLSHQNTRSKHDYDDICMELLNEIFIDLL
jgi:hypothetical protein